MLNRPTNIFDQFDSRPTSGARTWDVDRQPGVRVLGLFVVIAIPLLLILGKLAHLQCVIADRFLISHDQTIVDYEPIPSRDGRILAADGTVLAEDIERFSVAMHYRWLEDPANADWLRERAYARLSRKERKNRVLVQVEERRIRNERVAMWGRLAELASMSPSELKSSQAQVQQRVERIVENVKRNREQTARQHSEAQSALETPVSDHWLSNAWEQFQSALTKSPDRTRDDPLVIKEELSYHVLLTELTLQQAATVEAHPELYPGLRVDVVTDRNYPAKNLAPHIIGSRTRISDDEWADRQAEFANGDPLDYQPNDAIGQTGVERSYDRYLRGLRGMRKVVKNRRGEILHTETVRTPRIGRDVELTLSIPLQGRAEELLDEAIGDRPASDASADEAEAARVLPTSKPQGGCIVAIDVHTGAILAAASAPRFDLNLLINTNQDAWNQLVSDDRQPLFPRAYRMTIPPGSIFKSVTAVALLESGLIDPDASLYCRGYLDQPTRHRCYIYTHHGVGHHDVTLSDALCQSCNVYFFDAARRIGISPIYLWADRFGFGKPTGIDLPGERRGNLPGPAKLTGHDQDESQEPAKPWYPGNTLGLAIGQASLTVTPLQIARSMAAIANDGTLVTPHVVETTGPPAFDDTTAELHTSQGDSWGEGGYTQPRPIPGLTPGTLARVREGLERVVAHPRGTGYKYVRLREVTIAGKTGTAEVGGRNLDHAWFAGYVPADRPRVAFVVVLQNGGSGGRNAGPVAQKFVRAMLDVHLLRPSQLAMESD